MMDDIRWMQFYFQINSKRYETQLNEREMYVVWGKFEKRKQQLQLILNQMDSVEHFEVTKINEASQIIFSLY